jgi:hypothetical protein
MQAFTSPKVWTSRSLPLVRLTLMQVWANISQLGLNWD